MAFPAKTDWVENDLVTAADFNGIGENLNALYTPESGTVVATSNTFPPTTTAGQNTATTTSTSFAAVTGITSTITTTGRDVRVSFKSTTYNASNTYIYFDILVDGVRLYPSQTVGAGFVEGNVAGNPYNYINFDMIIPGLSAASHTFAITWRTDAGTAFLLNVTKLHVREV